MILAHLLIVQDEHVPENDSSRSNPLLAILFPGVSKNYPIYVYLHTCDPALPDQNNNK